MTCSLRSKRTLLLLLFLAGGTVGYAQNGYYLEEQRTFYGGLVAGTNITQVDGDNYKGYHNLGWNAGGVMYMRVSERVIGSMEMLYVQKGAHGGSRPAYLDGIEVQLTDYRIRTDYVEVPLQIYYHDKRLNHLGAGFGYARLVNTIEKVKSQPFYDFHVENYPFHKHDISFLIGGSLHLWRGFFANARFQYSILDARGESPPGISWHGQYHNVWTFRLMYLFGTMQNGS